MDEQTPTENVVPAQGKTPASLERRALLLRSMGKGSAVLAAASLPVHTLSNTPTIVIKGTSVRCSISGMQSGMGSRIPVTDTCAGKSPGYWHDEMHWTDAQKSVIYSKRNPYSDPRTTFNDVFGFASSSTLGGRTLYEYLTSIGGGRNNSLSLNNTDEWHWVCAWMNAVANNVAGTGVVNFPYTAEQVVRIYQNPGSFKTTRADALSFFKMLEL